MSNSSFPSTRTTVICTYPTTMNGTILPSMRLVLVIGVTTSCSSVPRSRSRTIAMLVMRMSIIASSTPMMPGTMNTELLRSGLYHGRTRISSGSTGAFDPARRERLRDDTRREPRRADRGLRRQRIGRVDDELRLRPAPALEVARRSPVESPAPRARGRSRCASESRRATPPCRRRRNSPCSRARSPARGSPRSATRRARPSARAAPPSESRSRTARAGSPGCRSSSPA